MSDRVLVDALHKRVHDLEAHVVVLECVLRGQTAADRHRRERLETAWALMPVYLRKMPETSDQDVYESLLHSAAVDALQAADMLLIELDKEGK